MYCCSKGREAVPHLCHVLVVECEVLHEGQVSMDVNDARVYRHVEPDRKQVVGSNGGHAIGRHDSVYLLHRVVYHHEIVGWRLLVRQHIEHIDRSLKRCRIVIGKVLFAS